MSHRILIIGGYGMFGGRTVDLLCSEPGLTLIVAGRSLTRAEVFCAERRGSAAHLIPAASDRESDLRAQITTLEPSMMLDASGPFQAYGDARHRLVDACIDMRLPYLDLADGSSFVAGIAAFDDAAEAAGIGPLRLPAWG